MNVETLLEENERLRSELEDYTSAVFAGLRENKLSDATIQRDYAAIGEAIESWRYRLLDQVEDDSVKKHHKHVLRHDKERELSARTRFPEGLDLYKMTDNAYSDYNFLSYVVMSILEEEIFKQPYPIGILAKYRTFMHDFEQDMEASQKDSSAMNNWRSDTIGHLVTSSTFEHERARALDSIFSMAKRAIVPWLPQHLHRAFADHESFLREQIIKPAIDLHQAMRSSTERYQFTKPRVRLESGRCQGSPYTLKDIESWRILSADDPVIALSSLNLGIARLNPGKPDGVVVQPVLIVSFSRSLESKRPPTQQSRTRVSKKPGTELESSKNVCPTRSYSEGIRAESSAEHRNESAKSRGSQPGRSVLVKYFSGTM
ncbi:MAG: hypothetical protein Q9160_000616 [Pyrenula sp. 1 TL-2023]